ncbi:hypothetical protein KQX54_000861 [Cotesia glomerata]|uniref:Uncharacterized protein n=1 Tax=Cotesia glomerata TaxID=32391 RepID=A0AAV7IZS4_COTGL|nr:hypothetical protein KQX54_000861 [Cotesia glomerata]
MITMLQECKKNYIMTELSIIKKKRLENIQFQKEIHIYRVLNSKTNKKHKNEQLRRKPYYKELQFPDVPNEILKLTDLEERFICPHHSIYDDPEQLSIMVNILLKVRRNKSDLLNLSNHEYSCNTDKNNENSDVNNFDLNDNEDNDSSDENSEDEEPVNVEDESTLLMTQAIVFCSW